MTHEMKPNIKKSAVVVCPGRGTYTKETLGYFKKYHHDKTSFLKQMDTYRQKQQQPSISELDNAERYRLSLHNTGDNASALIYSCAMADFLSINREEYDIVAVTGNSMGWYLALAAGGATNFERGIHIVNTMGTLMHNEAQGGQLIFPLCDENWVYSEDLKRELDKAINKVKQDKNAEIFTSIKLGSMAVIATNDTALKALLNILPKVQERYPFTLPHHGAFHSPLMQPISAQAMNMRNTGEFSVDILSPPALPLIDGRGHIWQPYSTNVEDLYHYTFDHQVCKTYDYSKAIEVACKEFAPDCLIILGPGTTLGPPTAQQLISMHWQELDNKNTFKNRQNENPFILSMDIPQQRSILTDI